ncbi:MAG: potassium channel family protein [Planctomycetota bacterium]|nr:potassium channel family protein [Planctomycetota bacterium]
MPETPPNSLEEVLFDDVIGDAQTELKEWAEKVINGTSIEYKQIKSLRALIDAVQQNKNAIVAPLRAERSNDWKPTDELTELRIYGGEILDSDCQALDIRITLVITSRFVGKALFDKASFAGKACFKVASFAGEASFDEASFTGGAWFERARFKGEASFVRASFAGEAALGGAWFGRARFKGHAWFCKAKFKGEAGFYRACFAGEASFDWAFFAVVASFRRARFAGMAMFEGAKVEGRFILINLKRPPDRLNVMELNLLPGSSFEIDYKDYLSRLDLSDRNPQDEPWMEEKDKLSKWIASLPTQSVLRWSLEYFDVLLWMRHPIRHHLGIGYRGNVIVDETSDKPEKLREAATQYNMLRNHFRTQPSTEEHEDLCHHRYMELRRRAAWRDNPGLWQRFLLGFEWLVMRNLLGYMIYPSRIAATTFACLFFFAMIFGLLAGESTITHSGVDPSEAIAKWNKNPVMNPIYFSLMTLVTLGYGDFAPLGIFKLLCGFEALLGVSLLALFTVVWGRKMIR